MKTKTTIVLSTFLVSSSLLAIYGVKNDKIKFDKNIINGSVISSDSQDKITADIVLQKLSILTDKCRGCGKCVRIDPTHFEINSTTRKAMVISSNNLNSNNLMVAINNCPDEAILLK